MMWQAEQVARFARGAGFHTDAVTTATAVALASSGGVAHYDHAVGVPGAGHYVGLWAIDIDRWPEYADRDLHVPYQAAEAAYDLTERHGGWSWSAVHEAGHHLAYVAHAGTARTKELHAQAPAAPFTIHHTDDTIRHCGARLAQLRADLTVYRAPWR